MPTRLINAKRTEIQAMTAPELKESIFASEGRVLMCQNYVMHTPLIGGGCLNPELSQALGGDMIMLNGYSANPEAVMPGLTTGKFVAPGVQGDVKTMRVPELRALVDIPIGVYLECGQLEDQSNTGFSMVRKDRVASRENLEQLLGEGVDFIVLGGNPGTGTTMETIIESVRTTKEVVGDKALVFGGKWEDGVKEPVLGDPRYPLDHYKDIIKKLIDAGADCITLPMPGSRWGIDVPTIRELVTFVHTYKPGTLTMAFLDGTVEGADEATVRQCCLWSKQTGADIHAVGDAGLCGMTVPEDIYQASITIKGRLKTFERMAASRR